MREGEGGRERREREGESVKQANRDGVTLTLSSPSDSMRGFRKDTSFSNFPFMSS